MIRSSVRFRQAAPPAKHRSTCKDNRAVADLSGRLVRLSAAICVAILSQKRRSSWGSALRNSILAFLLVLMVGGTVLFSDPVPSQADAPAAAGTPEALVAACNGWSGPAPRGAVAKRVVATVAVDGEFVPRTLSGWWVKAALDEALFGKDHPRILTVHGFCPAPKCKTLSVEHTTEQRVSIGVVYVRTVTTTKQRCKGKVSTSVTYSVWRNR